MTPPLDAGAPGAAIAAAPAAGVSARDELLASVSIPTPPESPVVPIPSETPAMPPDQPEVTPIRDPEPSTAPSPVRDPQPIEIPKQARAEETSAAAPVAWPFLPLVPLGLAVAWWRHWVAALTR